MFSSQRLFYETARYLVHMNLIALVRFTLLVFALTAINGCATNPVTGKQDLVFMSESQEIALGNQASKQIMQQYRPYDDAALQS